MAIELAAARCKFFTPEAMLTRLESRLEMLTGGMRDLPARQQTLRNTLDWSYDLLDDEEKVLFARLAVFRGGRTLEAIEAVCSHNLSIDVFDGIASLVDKNLIQQVEGYGGEPRFWMLETIHEYAWERLEAGGEVDTMRQRHAEFFVSFAQKAEPELRLSRRVEWGWKLETDQDNLRAALEWTLMGDYPELGSRLVGYLREFWWQRSHSKEGLQWAKLALTRRDEVAKEIYGRALITASYMDLYQGMYEEVTTLSSEARTIFQETEDKYQLALALNSFATVTFQMHPGESEKAEVMFKEALTLFRKQGEIHDVAFCLNAFGEITRMHGDYEQAEKYYEESLSYYHQVGGVTNSSLSNLAFVVFGQGDYQRAQSLFAEALAISQQHGGLFFIAHELVGFAGLAEVKGERMRAARLIGAADALLEVLGARFMPTDYADYERIVTAIRAQLDEAEFEEAIADGRAMTMEQAIAYALEVTA